MPYLPNSRYSKALQHNGCICLLAGHRAEFLDLSVMSSMTGLPGESTESPPRITRPTEVVTMSM